LLYLICQANWLCNPKITFRDPFWGHDSWVAEPFSKWGDTSARQ